MQGREQFIENGPGFIGDIYEKLATILWVRRPPHEAPTLEGIEHRGHRSRGDDEPLGDNTRLERLVCPFDDCKRHPGRCRKSVVTPGLAVVQPDQHVTRTNQIGITLGGQRIGTGELGFEVLANPDKRLRRAPARTAIAVLSASGLVGGDVAQLSALS